MSREYRQFVKAMHEDIKARWDKLSPRQRHVEYRVTDLIYVYLFYKDRHIQTHAIEIPDDWWEDDSLPQSDDEFIELIRDTLDIPENISVEPE